MKWRSCEFVAITQQITMIDNDPLQLYHIHIEIHKQWNSLRQQSQHFLSKFAQINFEAMYCFCLLILVWFIHLYLLFALSPFISRYWHNREHIDSSPISMKNSVQTVAIVKQTNQRINKQHWHDAKNGEKTLRATTRSWKAAKQRNNGTRQRKKIAATATATATANDRQHKIWIDIDFQLCYVNVIQYNIRSIANIMCNYRLWSRNGPKSNKLRIHECFISRPRSVLYAIRSIQWTTVEYAWSGHFMVTFAFSLDEVTTMAMLCRFGRYGYVVHSFFCCVRWKILSLFYKNKYSLKNILTHHTNYMYVTRPTTSAPSVTIPHSFTLFHAPILSKAALTFDQTITNAILYRSFSRWTAMCCITDKQHTNFMTNCFYFCVLDCLAHIQQPPSLSLYLLYLWLSVL